MSWTKLTIDDEAVYGSPFVWRKWMWEYSSHEDQSEVQARYEFCKRVGADRSGGIGCCSGENLWLTLESAGRKWICPCGGDINREFDPQWLDHARVYRNSRTGQTWVHCLVYFNDCERILAKCERHGIEVEFQPYDRKNPNGEWWYVIYSMPVKPRYMFSSLFETGMGWRFSFVDLRRRYIRNIDGIVVRNLSDDDKADMLEVALESFYFNRNDKFAGDMGRFQSELLDLMQDENRNKFRRRLLQGYRPSAGGIDLPERLGGRGFISRYTMKWHHVN